MYVVNKQTITKEKVLLVSNTVRQKRGEVEFTHSCIAKDASYQQSLSFACFILAYSRKTAPFE